MVMIIVIMNEKALHDITYGLYLIGSRSGERDGACISNTVIQAANSPNRIAVSLNKSNYTTELILNGGKFGFQRGRNADKCAGADYVERAEGGIYGLKKYCLSRILAKVADTADLGSHILFAADVLDCDVLACEKPVTYAYYLENIKPKPVQNGIKGFRCKVCGYFVEKDVLPPDFTCPVCKHPASDFERVS